MYYLYQEMHFVFNNITQFTNTNQNFNIVIFQDYKLLKKTSHKINFNLLNNYIKNLYSPLLVCKQQHQKIAWFCVNTTGVALLILNCHCIQ